MESISPYQILENGDVPLKEYPFKNKETIRQNILKAITQIDIVTKQKKQHRTFVINITTAAVATVLLCLGSVYAMSSQTISTPGIRVLPDGSIVRLGRNTTLKYNSLSWLVWREVQIEGTGNFKVSQGSTFKVLTPIGYVKVVGTVFDVQTNDDTLKVVCHQGKIAVGKHNNVQNEVMLEQGQKIEWSNHNINKSFIAEQLIEPTVKTNIEPVAKQDTTTESTTKPLVAEHKQQDSRVEAEPVKIQDPTCEPEPQVKFEDAHLEQVITAIEQRWDVKIILNTPIDEIYFTGAIQTRSLDTTMLIITRTSGLNYTINGSQIIITK